jgi:hypothetical protein
MATIQKINIGNIVNDGLGDDLRTAFEKVNANFATLNNDLTITASNLGTVGEPVFKQKTGLNLEFKKLVAGNKITISSSPDSLLISSTVGNTFQRITTQSGFVDANTSQFVTIQGDPDIRVTAAADVITVTTVQDLNQILQVLDFGYIGTPDPSALVNDSSPSNFIDSIVQLAMANSNMDFGTFTNPGSINLDLGILTFDTGSLVP